MSTSILFAAGHFWAYFGSPLEIQTFVIYQTVYTLLISLWWGWVLLRYRSILSTMGLHFFFNLGFYLGFLTLS